MKQLYIYWLTASIASVILGWAFKQYLLGVAGGFLGGAFVYHLIKDKINLEVKPK